MVSPLLMTHYLLHHCQVCRETGAVNPSLNSVTPSRVGRGQEWSDVVRQKFNSSVTLEKPAQGSVKMGGSPRHFNCMQPVLKPARCGSVEAPLRFTPAPMWDTSSPRRRRTLGPTSCRTRCEPPRCGWTATRSSSTTATLPPERSCATRWPACVVVWVGGWMLW